MRWSGGILLALLALTFTLAATRVRLRARYRLRRGRQWLCADLLLFWGLWRRRWRIPPRGTLGLSAPLPRRVARRITQGRPRPHQPQLGAGMAGIKYLRGRVRLRRLRLDLAVGTGDPAWTAVAVGALYALLGTGGSLLPAYFRLAGTFRPEIRVVPEYRRAGVRLAAECIAQTSLGHLIGATGVALWHLWRGGRKDGRQWSRTVMGRTRSRD